MKEEEEIFDGNEWVVVRRKKEPGRCWSNGRVWRNGNG